MKPLTMSEAELADFRADHRYAGAILLDKVDTCHDEIERLGILASKSYQCAACGAWRFGGFALVLADVEPLPFVPWKGALGLFEVPSDYATRAEVQP